MFNHASPKLTRSEKERADAVFATLQRFPASRGPYCPIRGFATVWSDQAFGARERLPFQRGAQHNGWLATFEWFDANPNRKFHVRPALRGEPRNLDEPSNFCLVSAAYIDRCVFEQRVINASLDATRHWMTDRGEAAAKTVFEAAQGIALQWRWRIGRGAHGPIILAMERSQ